MEKTFKERVTKISADLAILVSEKNASYGNSVEDSPRILLCLYPNGVRPDQYEDMLVIVRVLDKLKRIASDKNAFGENPWRGIGGYALCKLAVEELATGGVKVDG